MKVKDTAMGMWFKQLAPEQAASYIAEALFSTRDGVFWQIVERYDLKAASPIALGYAVLGHLMEFDSDADVEE